MDKNSTDWRSQQFFVTKNGKKELIHIETDTKNIVDFYTGVIAIINKLKAVANGLATLGPDGHVPQDQLNNIEQQLKDLEKRLTGNVNNNNTVVNTNLANAVKELKDLISALDTKCEGAYVKKAGDTMTGGITFSKSATGNNYVGPGEGDVSDAVVANQSNLAINGWQTVGVRQSSSEPYTISMNARTGDIHTKGRITGDSTATFTGAVTAPTFNGHASEASKLVITDVNQNTVLMESTQTDGDGCRVVIGGPNDCNLYFQLNDSDASASTPSSFILEQRYNNYSTLQCNAILLDYEHNTTFPGVLTASRIVNAQYNDYAELFPKGEETEPGDLIVLDLDSKEEKYVKSNKNNTRVVGVHSDEYAHIIGGEKNKTLEENLKNFIPVALAGRVKVKFIGISKRNEYVVADTHNPGVARLYYKDLNTPEDIIGILVEEDSNTNPNEIRRLKIKLK